MEDENIQVSVLHYTNYFEGTQGLRQTSFHSCADLIANVVE